MTATISYTDGLTLPLPFAMLPRWDAPRDAFELFVRMVWMQNVAAWSVLVHG